MRFWRLRNGGSGRRGFGEQGLGRPANLLPTFHSQGQGPSPSTRALLYFSRLWEVGQFSLYEALGIPRSHPQLQPTCHKFHRITHTIRSSDTLSLLHAYLYLTPAHTRAPKPILAHRLETFPVSCHTPPFEFRWPGAHSSLLPLQDFKHNTPFLNWKAIIEVRAAEPPVSGSGSSALGTWGSGALAMV